MNEPCPENSFLKVHAILLLSSFHRATGKHLLPVNLPEEAAAQALFAAPFVVLSHDTQPDPIFTYGNKTAQSLFEITWPDLIQLPSRFSAELPNREERARLLQMVTEKGYIDDYEGIRISKTGTRFLVRGAIVWNLNDENGTNHGQAATFNQWSLLP